MKPQFITILLILFCQPVFSQDEDDFNYLVIKADSTLWMFADIKKDHTIFGYESRDTTANKLILFSVFTNKVKDNPYRCKYGAYYDLIGLNNYTLKLIKSDENFIAVNLIRNNKMMDVIYFEKKRVKIADQ